MLLLFLAVVGFGIVAIDIVALFHIRSISFALLLLLLLFSIVIFISHHHWRRRMPVTVFVGLRWLIFHRRHAIL